jgi:hypothetical protein
MSEDNVIGKAKRQEGQGAHAPCKPERNVTVRRGDVDGAHDVAGRAMPGKPEFSRAAFDRGNDLVGDVLVNVEAFALHGGSPCFAGRAIAASWGQGDRDH